MNICILSQLKIYISLNQFNNNPQQELNSIIIVIIYSSCWL